jgi:hypothetical protein
MHKQIVDCARFYTRKHLVHPKHLSTIHPIGILYDEPTSPFGQIPNATKLDLLAFSRLSKYDKARVMEAKIKLIAGDTDVHRGVFFF